MVFIELSDPRDSSLSVPPLKEEREEREEPLFGSSEVRLGGTWEELGGVGGTDPFWVQLQRQRPRFNLPQSVQVLNLSIFFSLAEVDKALSITNNLTLVSLRLTRNGIVSRR